MAIQRLSSRTDAGAGFGVISKVGGFEASGFLRLPRLVIQRVRFLGVTDLFIEAFVTLAHLFIGDERVDTPGVERQQITFAMKA